LPYLKEASLVLRRFKDFGNATGRAREAFYLCTLLQLVGPWLAGPALSSQHPTDAVISPMIARKLSWRRRSRRLGEPDVWFDFARAGNPNRKNGV
jgi:hypothetical protein